MHHSDYGTKVVPVLQSRSSRLFLSANSSLADIGAHVVVEIKVVEVVDVVANPQNLPKSIPNRPHKRSEGFRTRALVDVEIITLVCATSYTSCETFSL